MLQAISVKTTLLQGFWIMFIHVSYNLFVGGIATFQVSTNKIRTLFFPTSDPYILTTVNNIVCRSQWQRGLRRRSTAARVLRLWVRIPTAAWMFVCCEYCVLSGRGLCDELITLLEESYRLWCVVVCDQETSRMRRSWPSLSSSATGKKKTIQCL